MQAVNRNRERRANVPRRRAALDGRSHQHRHHAAWPLRGALRSGGRSRGRVLLNWRHHGGGQLTRGGQLGAGSWARAGSWLVRLF